VSFLKTGIVHFGPGAFHRAHQADYVQRLVDADPRWGIAAVSMRSAATVEALARQQGRYTLAIVDAEPEFRTIQVHTRFLGPSDGEAARRLLADPAIRLATATVTEKGYCLGGDGSLDLAHPDIAHDLAAPDRPASLIGRLALGLADRRAAGLPPFITLCCDNMAANGAKLRAAVAAFAACLDPVLADWIRGEAVFPDSMVDSITPASDDALRALVRERTGVDDEAPVSREAYAAWVIEDVLPADAPDLAAAGAVLTRDVRSWERAKLRILNGAHSSLAWLGLLLGHENVAEAMGDDDLAAFVELMIRADILPSLRPSPLDLGLYATQTLGRFRNPAIRHLLSQIAWDSSQKLSYRLLDTVRAAREAGRPLDRLAAPIAAWMLFVERQARAGAAIVDPLAAELARIGRGADPDEGLLGLSAIFPPDLAADPRFRAAIFDTARAMRREGVRPILAARLRHA
jgi:fructuronate reductase